MFKGFVLTFEKANLQQAGVSSYVCGDPGAYMP